MNRNWLSDGGLFDSWLSGRDWSTPYLPVMPNPDDVHHWQMEEEVINDGVVVIRRFDLDGDEAFDLISISTTTERPNGERQLVVELRDGTDTLLRRVSTTTSADENSKITTVDLNGDGIIDYEVALAKADDGTIVRTLSKYSESGALKYQGRSTFNPAENTVILEFDRDGDGQFGGNPLELAEHGFRPSIFTSGITPREPEQGLPDPIPHDEDRMSWVRGNAGGGGPSENAFHTWGDTKGQAGPAVDHFDHWFFADQFVFFERSRNHDQSRDTDDQTNLFAFGWDAKRESPSVGDIWDSVSDLLIEVTGHPPLLQQREVPSIFLAPDDFLYV